MTVTAAKISEDIASLDLHIDDLKSQADVLALDAVSGSEPSRKELARLLGEIERVTQEKPILLRAREQAKLREIAARSVIDAADREQHLEAARNSAATALAAAKRADEMITTFVACMADIAAAEKAIHGSLRAAGEPISVGIVGRFNASAIALERMKAACSGRLHFLSDQRTLSHILAAAWADLHEEA